MSGSKVPTARFTDPQNQTTTLNRHLNALGEALDTVDGRISNLEQSSEDTSQVVADAATPPDVTGLSASENGYIIDGVLFSEVTMSYTAPDPLGSFAGVFAVVKNYRGSADLVKVAEDTYSGAAGGSKSFKFTLQRTNETITLYAVAKNQLEAAADDWSTSPNTTVLLDGNASAPNSPTGVAASSSRFGVALSWTANSESNLAGYKVYRNTTNNSGTSTLLTTVGVPRSGNPSFTDSTVSLGIFYYYWITAVNTAAQESGFSSSVHGYSGAGATTANVAGGNFGSATTTSTITLYYDGTNSSTQFVLRFGDGSTVTVPTGNTAVTGLSASQLYYFYPYYDIGNSVVNFVTGGTGSPAIAFTAKSDTAAAGTIQEGRIPLSGVLSISTSTTGSGSGGGDLGGGSACVAAWSMVQTKRGKVPIAELKKGQHILCKDGWSKVVELRREDQEAFVYIETENGKKLDCSLTHPICLADDTYRYARSLLVGDVVRTEDGPSPVKKLRTVVTEYKSFLPSCEPCHEFYADGILTHNVILEK